MGAGVKEGGRGGSGKCQTTRFGITSSTTSPIQGNKNIAWVLADQTRRRENSGSLPLDQILSRRPSPSNVSGQLHPDSSSDGVLTPQHSMDPQRVSSSSLQGGGPEDAPASQEALLRMRGVMTHRRSSRLRASSLPSELECGLLASLEESHSEVLLPRASSQTSESAVSALPSTQASDMSHGAPYGAEGSSTEFDLPVQSQALSVLQLQQLQEQLPAWAPMSASAAQPAPTAGSSGLLEESAQQQGQASRGFATPAGSVPTCQQSKRELGGLSGSNPAHRQSQEEVLTSHEGTSKTTAPAIGQQQPDDLLLKPDAASHAAELASDAELAADLDEGMSQRQVKMKNRLQQHPWLLHFYDRAVERDYAQYHAQQMLKVSLASLGSSASPSGCIALRLHCPQAALPSGFCCRLLLLQAVHMLSTAHACHTQHAA